MRLNHWNHVIPFALLWKGKTSTRNAAEVRQMVKKYEGQVSLYVRAL
jgi:hypothetical protein